MERLTKSEEEIMHILWKIAPCTVSQVLDYIEQELGEERTATLNNLYFGAIDRRKKIPHSQSLWKNL